MLSAIRSGDRVALGRAITLVESTRPDHQEQAQQLIEACLPYSGNSIRLGITGVPGVGKSTFIEALGLHLIDLGKKPAVLAIDPSSSISKGSILGDKTRMNQLSVNQHAFIRPTASGGSLGGVARRTRETIILCEAAGFDVVLIETVGVGQSETMVSQLVDVFLLLMLSGAGDELQGIKRGIMEMADALVINKADGDNLKPAQRAAIEYKNALHLFPAAAGGWVPQVSTCSSTTGDGIAETWQVILDHQSTMSEQGLKEARRKDQSLFWFRQNMNEVLLEQFRAMPGMADEISALETQVANQSISPYRAAYQLIHQHLK